MSQQRLQKILSQAGISSRRHAEELIIEGRVTVNGTPAILGQKADFQKDTIKVNGKRIHALESHVYFMFHKPKGVIGMMQDAEGRPALGDFLTKINLKIFPINRLDYNSTGLVLLTNDGDFSDKLQKSRTVERLYEVKIKGKSNPDLIDRLRRGYRTETGYVKPVAVRLKSNLDQKALIHIIFRDAPKFDLKNWVEERGFLIERVTLKQIGGLSLGELKPGEYEIIRRSTLESALKKAPSKALKFSEEFQKHAAEEYQKNQRRTPFGASDRNSKRSSRSPSGRSRTTTKTRSGERSDRSRRSKFGR